MVTDLGGKFLESVLDTTGDTAEQIANLALFQNIEANSYWSATDYVPDSTQAWTMSTFFSLQIFNHKFSSGLLAAVVRPGDVNAVPEPQPLALLLAAITALAWVRRRPAPAASRRA